MRLLAISGSLRAISSNTTTLQAAALLAPAGVEVVLYQDLGALPHFNPDLDTDDPPVAVQELRRAVGQCDGLLICSPEYAHGVAGSLKNALDWLVRSVEFPGKPVALINASPRAVHADAQLREILRTMSAQLIEAASVGLPVFGSRLDAVGLAADPALSQQLRELLRVFTDSIAALPSEA